MDGLTHTKQLLNLLFIVYFGFPKNFQMFFLEQGLNILNVRENPCIFVEYLNLKGGPK